MIEEVNADFGAKKKYVRKQSGKGGGVEIRKTKQKTEEKRRLGRGGEWVKTRKVLKNGKRQGREKMWDTEIKGHQKKGESKRKGKSREPLVERGVRGEGGSNDKESGS